MRSWTSLGVTFLISSAVGCGGAQQGQCKTEPPPAAALPPSGQPQPAAAVEPPAAKTAEPVKASAVAKAPFGSAEGKEITLYTLTNANGFVLKVMNFGATVTEFQVPDKAGKKVDVVGGFATFDEFTKDNNPHFNGIVGRVANRIKGAQFGLDGKTYKLANNNNGDWKSVV